MTHRILGIDPGLRSTGWGVIETHTNHLKYIACGQINAPASLPLPERLKHIHLTLKEVIETWIPNEVALEETYVNCDPQSAMKLGYARAIALFTPALYDLSVYHYAPTVVKKIIVGNGHATKDAISIMVRCLLPTLSGKTGPDAIDALALAITHAYKKQSPLFLYNQASSQ
jgi:crossover junction endodeoxyribonuclease RuvC